MAKAGSWREEVEKCKPILEEFLLTDEHIVLTRENTHSLVCADAYRYFRKEGYEKWVEDKVVAGALLDFYKKNKIFEGKIGRFRIQEHYGIHSTRYFEAIKLPKAKMKIMKKAKYKK